MDRLKYPPLALPAYAPKVRSLGEQIQIFDPFRRKFVMLTPEEWVRQHFAHYLTETLNYPATRLHLEFQIRYQRRIKRPDIAVINDHGEIEILVECKAPNVRLDENVFLQVSTYFSVLKPTCLVMTNGIQHVFAMAKPNSSEFVYIKELPPFR